MTLLEPEIIPIKRADITGDGAWWCSGCGDFGVDAAIKQVILSLVNDVGVPLENMFALSGIETTGSQRVFAKREGTPFSQSLRKPCVVE